MVVLPPAPKQHDQNNQNAVRRELMLRIQQLEQRLTKLGA